MHEINASHRIFGAFLKYIIHSQSQLGLPLNKRSFVCGVWPCHTSMWLTKYNNILKKFKFVDVVVMPTCQGQAGTHDVVPRMKMNSHEYLSPSSQMP